MKFFKILNTEWNNSFFTYTTKVFFPVLAFFTILNSFQNIYTVYFTEAAKPWQLMFQDSGSAIMEGIVILHNDLMSLLVLVAIFVTYIIIRALQLFDSKVNPIPDRVTHGTFLEVFWTLTPAVMLMVLAVPSFALLYAVDEEISPIITLKAIGHQWYWSYEYSDYWLDDKSINFDSYMVPTKELAPGALRLLEVDRRVVLPQKSHIRVLVTAADVLHCWGIPSLGIKLDACPGRLNQTSLFIKRPGVYYGQCSEICGENHGFMPIVVESVNIKDYANWVWNRLWWDNV